MSMNSHRKITDIPANIAHEKKGGGSSYQGLNWHISPLHNHPFASKLGCPFKAVFTFVLPQILY